MFCLFYGLISTEFTQGFPLYSFKNGILLRKRKKAHNIFPYLLQKKSRVSGILGRKVE